MNPVGIVSIAVGILAVIGRGALLLAPAATLRWFKRQVATNGRVRVMAVIGLALGALMFWAGSLDDSGLATVLTVIGIAALAISSLAALFPGGYREFADALLPAVETASLTRWRILGVGGVIIGVLFIYFGVRAL